MKDYDYKPRPRFVAFKAETLWGTYKLARRCGLGRWKSWYEAWTTMELRNKQIAEMCRGFEIEIEAQTQGVQRVISSGDQQWTSCNFEENNNE